jgi:hypothetical protein
VLLGINQADSDHPFFKINPVNDIKEPDNTVDKVMNDEIPHDVADLVAEMVEREQ